MPSRSLRTALSFTTLMALVATPLALGFTAPAQAAPSAGLVISEVFGANSATNLYNQDFVELYNPTASAISLDGKSIQYRSATGASAPSGVTALSGSVPAGSYYLIGMASTAGGTALPTPDATSTINLSGTAGTVILANKATALTLAELPLGDVATNGATNVIDLLGYGTSNTYETVVRSGAPTNTTTAIRVQADTDNNSTDFVGSSGANPPSPTPATVATVPLAATDPGDKTIYVDKAMTSFTLAATGGTAPYTWSATGLPDGVTVSSAGLVSGTPTALGTYPVTATATDNVGATASTEFDIVVSELPVLPLRTIPEIQGTGAASPLAGQDVRVEGIVTARYPDGGVNGYVIQTPGYDAAADATPGASDGLFVYFGSTSTYTVPAVGDHVTILSGRVSEAFGITEVTVTNGDFVQTRAATPEETVVPGTVIPGTDCVEGECLEGAALDAVREEHEHEAFLPAGDHTVTDSYSGGVGSSSMRGEFKLAMHSDTPLYIPLQLAKPTETDKLADIAAFNAAHGVVLDDGATVTFNSSTAYPWLTLTNTVRGGANATFVKPVVLDYRFSTWRLQPSERIPAGNDGSAWVTFEQDRPGAPDDVMGDDGNLKIATFNMLNYFVHPTDEWVATGGDATPGTARTCSTYKDRASVPITANTCTWTDPRTDPDTLLAAGPRGAATQVSLARQQVKEVAAINTMAADVMSLEEVENPVKLGYSDRDAALKQLVDALNADWDATHPGEDPAVLGKRWDYVASPRPEAQPTIAEQDAIRNAFIYNPRAVATVGRSEILVNSAPFRNAREPLAQAFRHVDGSRDDAFIVVVNHFKSKSAPDDLSTIAGTDNEDIGNGAGSYNGDRTRQAKALDVFADSLAEDKGIDAVFMTGDYNAYSQETPVTTLEGLGWHELSADNGETSYFFGGLAGSLDHMFANDAGLALLEGSTVWPINANEPIYYEYSRYNYNVTPLYDQTAFRSSDHNPEIIGIKARTSGSTPVDVDTVQILASNDFHGRLLDDPASASAGAAAMAGAVKELRAANPDTAFVMAGDIVGASTFESFIQNDKPTIDAMNEAGLEVSAAGNHEFDQGYDDLMNRIMASYDADANPEGGADWPYIAANVRLGDANGAYALDSDRTDGNFAHSNGATWWKEFPELDGGNGINVGFVGAVTEDLDSLVAPSAIDGLAITSIVDEVNNAAADLKVDGCGGEPCDLVIELVHEGAPTPDCATIKEQTSTTFGRIVHEASADVDAIISGHTHLKYNCKVDVVGKALPRPVVSAGQYGSYLNQLEFEFAPETNNLVNIRQHVLAMKDYDEDADTKTIVNAAVDVAAVKGAVELGQVAAPFKRARRTDASGVVENRGGESTLGNLVAEIQRYETGADIGVMNPGGLRDDLVGTGETAGPVTYREAANVQPFANTLVTVDLTGAQLKVLLEQQWQRDPDGNVPSRPFLRLGTSKGFTWTENSSRAEGDRITGMWLDGVAIDPAGSYTVSANSFLAVGGDNFRALTLGTNKQDTGKTDLQATVDYLAAFASDAPLPVDYEQHGVGARVPAGPFTAGQTVTFPVDSLSMTGGGSSADVTDLTDSSVTVSYGATDLGTFPVTTTLPSTPFDVPGAATVSFVLPSGLSGGTQWFTLTGGATGTVAQVPVQVTDTRDDSTVSGTAEDIAWGEAGSVSVTVTPATATGTVELYDGTTKIGEGTLTGDATTIAIPAESLAVGDHSLTLKYLGDAGAKPSQGSVDVTVVKASSSVSGAAADITWGQAGSVSATVTPAAATGKVELFEGATKLGEGTLSGGAASITIAAQALPVGDHELTLKYLGDGHHAASQSTVDVTVVKVTSTVTATPTPASVVQDSGTSSIAVAVTATGVTPTGSVSAWLGGTQLATGTLVNGQATLVVGPFATVGAKAIEIRYGGTTEVSGDTETVTVTVTAKPTPQPTPTTVTGTGTTVQWAKAGSVTVSVAPAAATGTVELYDGATKLGQATLSGGSASIALAAKSLEVGSHTLVVKYLGSATYAASQGTVTVTVTKVKPKVSVQKPEAIDADDKVKVKVEVSTDGYVATGKVRIVLKKVGGTKRIAVTRTLIDGESVARFGVDRTGRFRVTVTYLGDEHTLRGEDGTHVWVG